MKFLAGDAGPEEAMAVGEWLETPANAAAFAQLQEAWNVSGPGLPYRPPDVPAEWERWRQNQQPRRPRRTWARWAAAAAVVLLAGSAWFLLQDEKHPGVQGTGFEAGAQPQRFSLPDSSAATLQPRAKIAFVTGANGERDLELTGSAGFDVKTDPQHPFTVFAGPLVIRVVGTVFDVRQFTDSITVSVSQGAVLAMGPADSLLLKAGQKGVYHVKAQRFAPQVTVSPGVLPSRTVFDFNDTPLGEAARMLTEAYGIPVRLDHPALAHCRINAAFTDKPLDYVLTVITESLRLEYRKANDTVYIYGNACD